MTKDSQNPYLNARNFACLTRITAAEELAISERSLKAYEDSERQVPDDVVLKMSHLYQTPWLRVQHLQRNIVFCDIFGLVPEQVDNKAANVLKMQKEVGDLVKAIPSIIESTVANINLSNKILQDCKDAIAAILPLVGGTNGKAASAGTLTAEKVTR